MVERCGRRAVEQSKGTGVGLDGIIDDRAEQAVEPVQRQPPQARLAAGTAHRAHHFRPVAPCRHQLGNDLGRILQIRIHRHHRVCRRGGGQAGGQRRLQSEISGKVDELETGIPRVLSGNQLDRPVLAAVVDEDRRPDAVGVRSEYRGQPRQQLRQDGLFVEDGNHDGDRGQVHDGGLWTIRPG